VNGLDVDCTGKTAGVSCTGEPDGLLDNNSGLMSSDAGIATAKYLMRCALPAGDSLRIKDYTGGLIVLSGELGLAPTWKDSQCDDVCQQKISACLMAFTNGKGDHIEVELSAPFTLGTGHTYKFTEGAFYGNLFQDKPAAYYCIGKDYAISGLLMTVLETRSCSGYNSTNGSCPYVRTGYCSNALSLNLLDSVLSDNKCSFGFGSDTATGCKDPAGGLLAKQWKYPITTFRKVQK